MTTVSPHRRTERMTDLIHYPHLRKKEPKSEPLSCELSRKCLAIYRAAVEKNRQVRQLTVQSSTASRRPTTSASATMLAEGEKAFAQGKLGDALSCFLEAVRMGEKSAELFTRIGSLFRGRGQVAEALDYFTRAILLNPSKEENYLNRAECYLEVDNPAEAFDEFVKYLKLTPATKAILVRCGKAALDADRLDDAERYLRMTLAKTDETEPQTDAYAWYNLGELAERKKEDALAKEHYKNVCICDPTFPDPYEAEAEEEFANNNLSLALHLFEAVAKMRPESAKAFNKLAEVYAKLGDEFSPSVLACLTQAIELCKPGDKMLEDVLVRRGRLNLAAGDPVNENRAISDFTLCLDINPSNSDALESRGWTYQKRNQVGDQEASAADYEALVALPDVSNERKSYPYRSLALRACEEGRFIDAARFFAFAGACGDGIREEDAILVHLAMAHAASQVESFDEQYEPRPWQAKEAEKGSKKGVEVVKPFPVASLAYSLVDGFYLHLRDQEPTVHSEREYQLIHQWKPYRDSIERHREENELLRSGKKGKKK